MTADEKKKLLALLKSLARLEGFEPPAHGLEVRSSIHLSYRRAIIKYDGPALSSSQFVCSHFPLLGSPGSFKVTSKTICSRKLWNMIHNQIVQEDKTIQEELEKEVTHLDQREKELIQENARIKNQLASVTPNNLIDKRNLQGYDYFNDKIFHS